MVLNGIERHMIALRNTIKIGVFLILCFAKQDKSFINIRTHSITSDDIKRGFKMKMDRTTSGLRGVLLDEIDTLRSGETAEGRAHAIARLANATIATVRLEMDAHEFMSRNIEPNKIVNLSPMKPLSLVA